MTTKQLNIKNRIYYHDNDLINALKFEANNLKLDKKTWKDLDIYFIGYVDKKPEWNVNSVNPLYLLVNRVYGSVSEKNGNKYLIIDKGDSVLKNMIRCFLELNIISKKLMIKKLIITLTITKLNF